MRTLSISEENLLKSIYYFTVDKGNKIASTNDVAKSLSIRASSATEMIKKLDGKGWLIHTPYKGCELTEQGLVYITSLVRRHRIWETFLTNILKFGWHEVHAIAEELEHVDSDKLINRLFDFLGKPLYDPHGHRIPSANHTLQLVDTVRLTDVTVQKKVRIISVSDKDSALLNTLQDYPLKLGQVLRVLHIDTQNKEMTLQTEETELCLPHYICNIIYVKDYE